MTSLAAQVTSTGITAPPYADILASLIASFQSIYGIDSYLGADSQDGQMLAVVAKAINDSNQTAIAVFNSFSPQTAQGEALSSRVKMNGIRREIPTRSTATVTIVGQAGTVISSGVVKDNLGYKWDLPVSITIPIGGSVSVTATCQTIGNIIAPANSINKIAAPQLGWQSVTNPSAAVQGSPVESDATLRQRQSISTSIGALSVLDSISANVANVAGVSRSVVAENPTGATDVNGIPAHSISAVVAGGSVQDIIDAIGRTKTAGTGTYGTTTGTYIDAKGIASTIKYFTLDTVSIKVEVDITALSGYVSSTGDALKQAVAAYISANDIGEDVYFTRLFTPANLQGSALGETYVVTAIRIAVGIATPTAANISIAFNQAAQCIVGDITLTVS